MAFKRVLSIWRPSVDFSKAPSLTRQEFLADADINNIVAKFLHTGVLNQPNLGRPSVDGLDSPGDFTEACDMFFNNDSEQSEFSEQLNDSTVVVPKEEIANGSQNGATKEIAKVNETEKKKE